MKWSLVNLCEVKLCENSFIYNLCTLKLCENLSPNRGNVRISLKVANNADFLKES